MLDHVSIGVADLKRTKKFYDAALKSLGYKCLSEGAESLGYGDKSVALWISPAKHPVKPDMQSGLHFCFAAPTRKSVDAFHVAALGAGGKDNGGPGLREWVDDAVATPGDLDALTVPDERSWEEERRAHVLY